MSTVAEAESSYQHALEQEMFAERALVVAAENVAYWGLQLEVARRRELCSMSYVDPLHAIQDMDEEWQHGGV